MHVAGEHVPLRHDARMMRQGERHHRAPVRPRNRSRPRSADRRRDDRDCRARAASRSPRARRATPRAHRMSPRYAPRAHGESRRGRRHAPVRAGGSAHRGAPARRRSSHAARVRRALGTTPPFRSAGPLRAASRDAGQYTARSAQRVSDSPAIVTTASASARPGSLIPPPAPARAACARSDPPASRSTPCSASDRRAAGTTAG